MRKLAWAAALAAIGLVSAGLAAERMRVDQIKGLVVGDLVLRPGEVNPLPIGMDGEVTGFAFAPGRPDLAYCAIERDEGGVASVLRIVRVQRLWPEARERMGERTLRDGRVIPVPESYDYTPTFAERERELVAVPLAGVGETAPGLTMIGPVRWSPDERWLALYAVDGGRRDVWLVDTGSGERRALTEGATVTGLTWSPDSRWIAYVVTGMPTEPDRSGVWLADVRSGERRRVADSGSWLQWSADGDRLLFFSGGPPARGLSHDLSTHETRLTEERLARELPWQVSPNGRHVAQIGERTGSRERGAAPWVRQRKTGVVWLSAPGAARDGCWAKDGSLLTYVDEKGAGRMTALYGPHRGYSAALTARVNQTALARQQLIDLSVWGPMPSGEPGELRGASSPLCWAAYCADGKLRVRRIARGWPIHRSSNSAWRCSCMPPTGMRCCRQTMDCLLML